MEMVHEEFVRLYKEGKLEVAINERKAGDFVLSEFADKHNKPAHHFWTWAGVILLVPLPLVLLFFNWVLALGSFVVGYMVHKAARKSACQFVLQNMIDDDIFFEYVLLQAGAEIKRK